MSLVDIEVPKTPEGSAEPSPGNVFKPAAKPKKTTARRRRKSTTPRTTTPRPAARKNLSEGLGTLYALIGAGLSLMYRVPVYDIDTDTQQRYVAAWRPSMVGEIMQVQAPAAGMQLNRVVKEHPRIHDALAPIFGASEFSVITEVFMPPAIVAILERKPELFPMFKPVMLPLLRNMFISLKAAEAEQAEMMEKIAEGSSVKVDTEEFQRFVDSLGFGDAPEPPPAPEPFIAPVE